MKKINLKLEELEKPELLTAAQMKNLSGGNNALFCYTGSSCDYGGTCTSTMAGNDCVCESILGVYVSPWCG